MKQLTFFGLFALSAALSCAPALAEVLAGPPAAEFDADGDGVATVFDL